VIFVTIQTEGDGWRNIANALAEADYSSRVGKCLRTCSLHLDENRHLGQMPQKTPAGLPIQVLNDKGRYHA
jgi:hypothetical protein